MLQCFVVVLAVRYNCSRHVINKEKSK